MINMLCRFEKHSLNLLLMFTNLNGHPIELFKPIEYAKTWILKNKTADYQDASTCFFIYLRASTYFLKTEHIPDVYSQWYNND
ncbi:hypothetical protein BpHYR1_049163 [Brachionus plicatilis]|uniref:Uncharacterized protein n=1 Tax=Brachionus plicatilis TaxID=10195 RepID=A0A3M7QV18_BRAPC|nr:hypothetical protein BpHYR1_049163 [Brachionus plicatilis]